MTTRNIRKAPHTFEHFPESSTCPVCRTNDDGTCVLVPIPGTQDDGIVEAKPVHLACSLPQWIDESMGILYRRFSP